MCVDASVTAATLDCTVSLLQEFHAPSANATTMAAANVPMTEIKTVFTENRLRIDVPIVIASKLLTVGTRRAGAVVG
jgi:hypothetical protein